MIWVWVAAAVATSWLFCKRGISWYHYIWLLLPIDMYGVTIAGATLKPYMLFGICIIIGDFVRSKAVRVHIAIVAIVFALIISNFLTGFVIASIMQHIMFILILIIGYCYQNYQSDGIEFDEMGEAALAATIGYGMVFTIVWLVFSYGVTAGGIYASERLDAGIVLKLTSFGGSVTSRLRGFCIDPNSVITTLIPGATFALANIVYQKREIFKNLLAISVYLGVVFYSGSRMALICSLGMLIVFFVIGYSKSVNKQRIAVIGIAVVVFLVIGMIVNIDTIILEVAKIWVDLFGNRSTLTSEYGRLTIWKTNIEYLISNSKEWIGVGQNQIYLLSKSGLACHNTWLEWICGTGIILGTIIDFWFILAPFRFKKRTDDVLGGEDAKNTMSIIMSYIAIVVCVSSVDNITNPVMLIIMNMLRFGKINGQTKSERVA